MCLAYIVRPPSGVSQALVCTAVPDQAVGPGPLDVLHGAAGLLEHDVAQAGVIGRGGAVSDGEVVHCFVAGQEDVDFVDHAGAVLGVRGKLEFAVDGHV